MTELYRLEEVRVIIKFSNLNECANDLSQSQAKWLTKRIAIAVAISLAADIAVALTVAIAIAVAVAVTN